MHDACSWILDSIGEQQMLLMLKKLTAADTVSAENEVTAVMAK